MPLVDLLSVKGQLKITGEGSDSALQSYIAAVDAIVEDHTGRMVTSQALTETLVLDSWTDHLILPKRPLTAVTSVTPVSPAGGTAYDLTGMVVRESGVVILPFRVFGTVQVAYTAGYINPPAHYKQAALIIAQHLWRTRLGPKASGTSDLPDTLAPREIGYAIPNQALELLGRRPPAVA